VIYRCFADRELFPFVFVLFLFFWSDVEEDDYRYG